MCRSIIMALVTLVLCGTSFAVGRATTSIAFDSQWWNELHYQDRIRVIQGEVDGYTTGYGVGYLAAQFEDLQISSRRMTYLNRNYFTGTRLSAGRSYYDAMAKAMKAVPSPPYQETTFSDNFGTYMDDVSHYYENHPENANKSPAWILRCYARPKPAWCKE